MTKCRQPGTIDGRHSGPPRCGSAPTNRLASSFTRFTTPQGKNSEETGGRSRCSNTKKVLTDRGVGRVKRRVSLLRTAPSDVSPEPSPGVYVARAARTSSTRSELTNGKAFGGAGVRKRRWTSRSNIRACAKPRHRSRPPDRPTLFYTPPAYSTVQGDGKPVFAVRRRIRFALELDMTTDDSAFRSASRHARRHAHLYIDRAGRSWSRRNIMACRSERVRRSHRSG